MKKIRTLVFAAIIIFIIAWAYSNQPDEIVETDTTSGLVSYTGTLRQGSEGFSLIMDSAQYYAKNPNQPKGQGVAYVLPISIKVSNVLGEFVGKNVKVEGLMGTSTETSRLFIVDRLEPLTGDAVDPSLGTVAVGQSVFINGVRITLNSVVQDSRCPIDVQCIQAGAINTNVTFESDTDKETRNMPSDEVPLSFDSYKISIQAINPPRLSGKETAQNEYLITFKVVPATPNQ